LGAEIENQDPLGHRFDLAVGLDGLSMLPLSSTEAKKPRLTGMALMTTGLLASSVRVLTGGLASGPLAMLAWWIRPRHRRREHRYDLLYSLPWGEATTNNYGFAPAETDGPERFQLQLYAELLKLLEDTGGIGAVERVLEISCGRGGGLSLVAARLPAGAQIVGLDYSSHALRFCRRRYAALTNVGFVQAHSLKLPFADRSFDLVLNVEASHVYRNDPVFLREVGRLLGPHGRFLYADYRKRRDLQTLEGMLRAAGFAGPLRDITGNVVRACELDSDRRRALIRSGLPAWAYLLGRRRLERYAGIPGTASFERLRKRDRLHFIACLVAAPGAPEDQAGLPAGQAI
jgi:ubiquinone/menaquinone biosynthesis C-methylase UbiE